MMLRVKFFKVLSLVGLLIFFAHCNDGGGGGGTTYYGGGGGGSSGGGGGTSGGGGGSSGGGTVVTNVFTLPYAMYGHEATLLYGGDKILLTGGFNSSDNPSDQATVYNSYTETFLNPISNLNERRSNHKSTYLSKGGNRAPQDSVLITGGEGLSFITNDAEYYDDVLDNFVTTSSSMIDDRKRHSATEIKCNCSLDGYVLIAGGRDNFGILDTAELFNPNTGQFIAVSDRMVRPREHHSGTLLPDGRVLLAGGNTSTGVTTTAEVFDPTTLRFTAASGAMSDPRQMHRAVLVGNRTVNTADDAVLVVGGLDDLDLVLDTGDLFDPIFDDFDKLTDTLVKPVFHEAVEKLNNSFLSDVAVLGGYTDFNPADPLDSEASSGVEYFRYSFTSNTPDGYFLSTAPSMERARALHSATLVKNGSGPIIVIGGVDTLGSARSSGEKF